MRSPASSTTPESDLIQLRPAPLRTVALWLGFSALCWWIAMPTTAGSWFPWNVGAALCWPWFLVRASLWTATPWRTALLAWGIFLVPWLVTLSWVNEVSVAGWPALALYSSCWMALTLLGIRLLVPSRLLRRVPWPLTAAVLFTALEYLRAEVVLDAWPFYLSAHALAGTDLALGASLGGVWLVSFFIVFTSVSLFMVLPTVRRLAPLLVIGVLWALAVLLAPGADEETEELRVLAVQTNLPQSNKLAWTPQQQTIDVTGFIEQTLDALKNAGPVDLVIWPETMVPGLGFDVDTRRFLKTLGPGAAHLHLWPNTIERLASETGVPWLVGAPTWLDVALHESGHLHAMIEYNSAVLVDPDGTHQRYDKIFLTPFGETMPWIRGWPWLEDRLMAIGAAGMAFRLKAGDAPTRLTLKGDWQLAVPVCFEDTVPSVVRTLAVDDGRTRAHVIVNLSNDGWFGDDDAARRAHEAAAIYRAIELGRPLLRVANTGTSAIISPRGKILGRIPPREAASLPVSIPRTDGTTPYARWGNWLAWLCLALTAVGLLLRIVGGPLRPMKVTT